MADQPDELVITLKEPIKNKAMIEITEIKLKEPTAAQWRKWDKITGVESDIMAVSVVSGQPLDVIEQMKSSQLIEGAAYLSGFLQAVPQIGDGE